MKEEETLPNSLYEAIITLIPQLAKDSTKEKKRKLQINRSYECRCKTH